MQRDNAMALRKQGNTNGLFAPGMEQIVIQSANNTVVKTTKIMTCSKLVGDITGSLGQCTIITQTRIPIVHDTSSACVVDKAAEQIIT